MTALRALRGVPGAVLGGVLAVILLAGCVSIPAEGPVVAGRNIAEDKRPPRVKFFPLGPGAGDSPTQTVRGFLAAAPDFTSNHQVARSFLTPDKRTTWRPDSPVLIYRSDPSAMEIVQASVTSNGQAASAVAPSPGPTSPRPPRNDDTAVVTVRVPIVARIFAGGVYRVSEAGDVQVSTFHLRAVEGQWRIDAAPDGVLISSTEFSATFADVPLYFPDRSGRWLVPDVRWFPLTSPPTVPVAALLDGPSRWLSDGVTTGFPQGTELTANGVRVDGAKVTIDLTKRALDADPKQRQMLAAQLRATLRQAAPALEIAVGEPVVTVEQARYEVPASASGPSPADDEPVDPRPVVLDERNRVARLDQLRAESVEGLAALPASAARPAVSPDGTAFAALTDGGTRLVTLVPRQAAVTVVRGAKLTAPSFDRFGWVWTASTQARVTVHAGRGERRLQVRAPWLAGYEVVSLRLSQEGARALVVAVKAGVGYLFVTAVVRGSDGAPAALSTPIRLVPDLTRARDASWIDSRRVAVLGTRQGIKEQQVSVVEIGGDIAPAITAASALSITAGASEYDLWVQTPKGAQYRIGASFLPVAGVRWPAAPG